MIPKITQIPNRPRMIHLRDWTQVALHFDRLVFSDDYVAPFFPLLWWDDENRNQRGRMFGLPSYVGAVAGGGRHEAINCVAAVLGATLVGVDKRHDRATNWVRMLEGYFQSESRLFLNRTNGMAGQSFWYDVYPHILLYALSAYYPQERGIAAIVEVTAARWLEAAESLMGADVSLACEITAFDFQHMRGVANGKWIEPDGLAGMAWLLFIQGSRSGNARYLAMAVALLRRLVQQATNPLYELLLPFGAYAAARANAEGRANLDVERLVNWCFAGDSVARPGWGVLTGIWGGHECHGLVGSETDWGQRWDQFPDVNATDERRPESGYAFAANTFAFAFPLVALVRYDPRFAHDIAKWMLHVAVNARLFYPGTWPARQQSCAFFRSDPGDVIAYEGLRKQWDGQSP